MKDIEIKKKALVMPWQRCARISVAPFDFSMNLQAMTSEKLQFSLPAVFTIGPETGEDALKKYARLLSGNTGSELQKNNNSGTPTGGKHHVEDIVKGIIEGETRVIVSSMSMEEIFKERQVFKNKVIGNVQNELEEFGLKIYNANVKELQDTPGSEYFAFLSRKAHEGALNQARVDVAEARMRGEIGESEKQGKTKQEISKIDAETAVLETKRKAEKAKADADLVDCKTALDARNEMSKIAAKRQNEMKEAELQKQLQAKKAETELERLRANDVTKSKVAREAAQETANASYYTEQKAADAHLYKRKMEADALYYRQSKEADAAFYKQKREAEGLLELSKGYGALVDVLGGSQAFLQFQMMQNGTYEKLAHANAQAINGLQPKITTWNTGNGDVGDSAAPIRNIMQNLPPLLSTIQEQTGISPPTWLAQMSNGHSKEPKMAKTTSG